MGRKRDTYETNIHHIINKCRKKEGYNVEHPDNKIRMVVRDHNNLHGFFENMTPQEMVYYYRAIVDGTLSGQSRDLIEELIQMDRYEFYNGELLQ